MSDLIDQPWAKKSLGQHWLSDTSSLEAMCDAAKLEPQDVVLEIGPGPGALTKLLVQRVSQVWAVELDKQLAENLSHRVPTPNLRVINQDILRFDLTILPIGYKVVANIPYYLTSNLLRVLVESSHPPQRAALLVQKEVAERAVAEPGSMSLLSVSVQFYWQASLGQVVPAKLFTPQPKVDSQILILQARRQSLFGVDTKSFFRLVKAGFSGRRKTLLNSLSAGLIEPKESIEQLLIRAGIDPKQRAQNLSLDDWYRLYQARLA